MDWEAIRDNLGLVVFAAIWLVSFLLRAARGKSNAGGPPQGPLARRRRARRRAVILGFALMAVAVALWEFSRGIGGSDETMLRAVAGGLAVLAIVAILVAGATRSGMPMQGEIGLEGPGERSSEIKAGEPLEPS